MTTVCAIAPHPDDETLGCGGTLLAHRAAGHVLNWIIVTAMTADGGFTPAAIKQRDVEIAAVADAYGFERVFRLGHPTALLDRADRRGLVASVKTALNEIDPDIVYLPFPGDVHTDHRVVFESAVAATKWFRIKKPLRLLCYETLSETDAGIDPTQTHFQPNWFVDISPYLDRKQQIMALYPGEVRDFPFPRSDAAIRALAHMRGAQCGSAAAEAFVLLREMQRIGMP